MNPQATEPRGNGKGNGNKNGRTEPLPKVAEPKSLMGVKGAPAKPGGTSSSVPNQAPNPEEEAAFQCEAPSAKSVLLAGDFTQWDKKPIKMIQGGGGRWHVKVPLTRGRHTYRFLVDGQWQNDPASHDRVPNGFGSFNNVKDV